MKSCAESRHVLEVRLLLHLDRQIIHPGVFQNGRHLRIRGNHTDQSERSMTLKQNVTAICPGIHLQGSMNTKWLINYSPNNKHGSWIKLLSAGMMMLSPQVWSLQWNSSMTLDSTVSTDLLYDPLLHHICHDLEVDGPCDHVGWMPPEMRVSVRQHSFDLLNLK